MFEGFSVEDDLFENIEELNHVALDYRQRLALIIADIRNFHGTEKQFEGLMDHMVALEKWMVEVFSVRQFVQKDRLSISEERELGIHFIGKENRTIDDLLALMQKRYDRWLERSLDQERAEVSSENFELVGANMEGVILPPGDVPIFYGFGENTFETSRFDDRLRQLLLFLQNHGIYSDDVIVVRGKVYPGMMRQLSYTIVEIPRIGREVLVCDQVGEATFVVKGILNRSLFATLTKEDLQERYGERVVRVVYRDSEQWEAELARTLFENVVFEEKVNVVDLEKLRQAIFAQVPTPEEWAGMKQKEKAVFKVGGLGLYAIATRFGAGGGPIRNHSVHMELGRKIYGEHEVLRELTNEELLVLIRREVSTPEEWAGMKYKEKLAFKVGGLGLNALSTRFGVEGNPIRNHSVYLELGRKIYGEDLVLREVTNEELLILIRREISTPEEWAGMRAREKGVFKVGGLGLTAVSTRFGVEGSPIHKHSVHLELGQKIYGIHPVFTPDNR